MGRRWKEHGRYNARGKLSIEINERNAANHHHGCRFCLSIDCQWGEAISGHYLEAIADVVNAKIVLIVNNKVGGAADTATTAALDTDTCAWGTVVVAATTACTPLATRNRNRTEIERLH
jgi:hypothetical protein